MGHTTYTSLTRIADLETAGFEIEPRARSDWEMGDYVLGEVVEPGPGRRVELTSGRMIEVPPGEPVVGALGTRHATLEATGDWREIGDDGEMHLLTGAGLFGRLTSLASMRSPLTRLHYEGHLLRDGRKLSMGDFVAPVEPRTFGTPTLLLVGTSMSCGKTTAARVAIRRLKRAGLRIVGAKITGAGRYRDVLTMGDAGADAIFDFVDVGLPSTVCPTDLYAERLEGLLSRIEEAGADVAVIEAGASPLEPYNGEAAIQAIGHAVRFTVLAASDPYAVVGVTKAFGIEPHLVTGVASNTVAGIELAERLSGIRTLNLHDPESHGEFDELLFKALEITG